MKERCENCQKNRLCHRMEETKRYRIELEKLNETRSWRGISGIINFHCDYFREIEK